MSNENQKTMGDDEYQYPNEEYVAETTPADEQGPEEPKRVNFFLRFVQNNKRITIIIAVIIVALIAFKFMSAHRRSKISPPPQPVVQEPAQPAVAQLDPRALSELNTLKQGEKNSQTTIGQLQNQIQDVRDQLSQAATQQSQLNQAVVALASQVKELTQTIQADESKKSTPAKKAAPPAPPVVFHLKAVIPGRAWIVSNDGLSESVAVGDTVPQYGTVKVVDANRGMVLMSSGKVIGYGTNDH